MHRCVRPAWPRPGGACGGVLEPAGRGRRPDAVVQEMSRAVSPGRRAGGQASARTGPWAHRVPTSIGTCSITATRDVCIFEHLPMEVGQLMTLRSIWLGEPGAGCRRRGRGGVRSSSPSPRARPHLQPRGPGRGPERGAARRRVHNPAATQVDHSASGPQLELGPPGRPPAAGPTRGLPAGPHRLVEHARMQAV